MLYQIVEVMKRQGPEHRGILLHGPRGIGKTELAYDFLRFWERSVGEQMFTNLLGAGTSYSVSRLCTQAYVRKVSELGHLS